ncbi:hypothetical protein N7448_005694 [Penicillium atrosanguineum]|uniref:uncharacterized protein n=1 Tax=Penicillium atrosanguineum TaxID=1132637 RepID=UPI0023A342B0|nr:uncharacterized protein N7443_009432 [Penicillium atrosanguineum]KAJ5126390.1 hypothetical protein N7526_008567 [Penicillium atrosanguineum]KAJ5137140.1 hypothetical protein N7448_005694 [Penicillium atrosanguineum]KAJ5293479.1 hypothetical protein N7443_009432 [Penicillium atrosanguineum]
MSWPRSQLLEIGDQSWCPSWLHQHEQLSLTKLWNLKVPFWSRGSLATQACEVFKEYLQDPSSYTVLDICAGSGGPTPVLESELNREIEAQGKVPVQFILSDLYPHVEAWQRISKKQQNVSYIETPVDARAVSRLGKEKECRIFNICFHHFSDEDAAGILKSAVESADAFIIYEMTSREVGTCLCSPLVFFWAFFVTLGWFWSSPVHLFFTYILPVAPFTIWIDGFISCLRTRTNEEIRSLLDQPGLDLSKWTFHSGRKTVQWPVISLHYYVGIKSD